MIRTAAVITALAATVAAAAGGLWRGDGTPAPAPRARAVATPTMPLPADWAALGRAANAFVAAETPAAALPYAPVAPRAGFEGRLVIAHYFPPLPLSFDGLPRGRDYYDTQYLQAAGEGGKHRANGGYLRVRPVPAPMPADGDYRRFHLAVEAARAARIGIDAFGVDLLTIDLSSPLWRTGADMLDAARAVSPTFRVIPQPDMGSIPATATPAALVDALTVFARHPAALRDRDGRLIVMPFLAEARPAAWWADVLRRMRARGTPVAFVPIFLDARTLPSYGPIAAGASIWGDRYATAAIANTASAEASRAAGIARWFMPVAFQDYRPKDRIFNEARGSESWRGQWAAVRATGSQGVHLATWNDYSESTQFAPTIPGGFGIYDLTGYQIAWYRAGRPPTIARDAAYLVRRGAILRPNEGAGAPLTVVGPTPLANPVEAVMLLRAPARVTLRVGARTRAIDAPAGLSTVSLPAAAGPLRVTAVRAGRTVVDFTGAPLAARTVTQDATYRVESSLR